LHESAQNYGAVEDQRQPPLLFREPATFFGFESRIETGQIVGEKKKRPAPSRSHAGYILVVVKQEAVENEGLSSFDEDIDLGKKPVDGVEEIANVT
jgi:hypothetical protein